MSSDALKRLNPTDFENLTFDLLILKGLQNVRWRTPGADGGRDIEADEMHIDFANTQIVRKWYVECKKYKGSVDWPTIFGKIAYAESQCADYLLMCTSSKFTPAAITQMEKWNLRRGGVQVRLWPGHEIEHHIKPYFDLRVKYGIDPTPTPQGDKLTTLALAVSKSIETYYGKLVFSDTEIDPMITSAQAISLLIRQRLEDIERFKKAKTSLIDIRDIKQFSVLSSQACYIDHYAYLAFMEYLSALTGESIAISVIDERELCVHLSENGLEKFNRYKSVFEAILFWGGLEWTIKNTEITLRQQI